MVIIISTVGATHMYQDQDMFRRTFAAFLHSLKRQTDQNFKLILVGHDRPAGLCIEEPNVLFYSVSADPEHKSSNVLTVMPTDMTTPPSWTSMPYGRAIDDMSCKTRAACYFAGLHAWQAGLTDFWMLRMDSDDLLACDVVAHLNSLDPAVTQAVYSRDCHMYDPRRHELAEHHYIGSLTCNSIYVKLSDADIPRLYYHFNDHTLFCQQVERDAIPHERRDWQLCITTNSQNSISGRPALEAEKNVKQIPVAADIVQHYGLEIYGGSHENQR